MTLTGDLSFTVTDAERIEVLATFGDGSTEELQIKVTCSDGTLMSEVRNDEIPVQRSRALVTPA